MNGLLNVLSDEDRARAARCDGWTGPQQAQFLRALADCGVVEKAAGEVKLSVASAYAFRRKADGAMFHLGWEAAVLLARRRLVDVLMSRAIDGQVDVLTRDGNTATRHRHDNRLGGAMLTRLDRLAEDPGEASTTARLIAQDFDNFIDMIENGAGGAQAALFIEAHRAQHEARMAGFCGANGYPQLKESGPPETEEDKEDEKEIVLDMRPGLEAYKDDDGVWTTTFPPPPDFDGEEEGCFGDEDYQRSLSDDEMIVMCRREEEELAEYRTLGVAIRDEFFGFAPKRPRRPRGTNMRGVELKTAETPEAKSLHAFLPMPLSGDLPEPTGENDNSGQGSRIAEAHRREQGPRIRLL
jgi:hypothetical protein